MQPFCQPLCRLSALGASALCRGFEARVQSWHPTFPSSMPNISVAMFRGVLWWLCGPDVFWVSPFAVFPLFVIEMLNPDLYRSDLYFSTSTPGSNNPMLRAHRSTLRRLDFTTGKRRNRGELPKIREADSLGQRTRAVEREYVGSHRSQH